MDCEKFESVMIDELHDELDELTSAAAKRHLAGCARCSALLSGLRAARRTAVLPYVEPPLDLEDRILTAARDAQREAPLRQRLSRVVSLAGGWAMRPQTAMAAVFLLMIGSSVLLLKGKSKAPSNANVTVSEQGSPAPTVAAGPVTRPTDLASADHAHGVPGAAVAARSTGASGAPDNGFARPPAGGPFGAIASEGVSQGVARRAPSAPSKAEAYEADRLREVADGRPASAAGAAGTPADDTRPAAESTFASPPAAAAPVAAAPAAAPMEAARSASAAGAPGADFDAAAAAFAAKDYPESTRLFDAAANRGDTNAALWAARSVMADSGCAAAVDRFDRLAARAFGTPPGYDATLEGGKCYRQIGDPAAAREHFVRLLTVTTHAQRARGELAALASRPAAKH